MGTANSSQAQILLTTTTHFTFIYVGEIRQLTIFRFYTFVAFCLPLGHVWTILTLPLASSPNLLFFVIQTTTLLSHITSNTSPNHKQECITSTMWQINYDTYKVQGLMPHSPHSQASLNQEGTLSVKAVSNHHTDYHYVDPCWQRCGIILKLNLFKDIKYKVGNSIEFNFYL